MTVADFKVEILPREVVVTHLRQGHRYRFPIVAGVIGIRAVIEPNPKARRDARGYLREAYHAARVAFD